VELVNCNIGELFPSQTKLMNSVVENTTGSLMFESQKHMIAARWNACYKTRYWEFSVQWYL